MFDIAKTIEAAVSYAEAQIGKPYSQPQRTLDGKYDCSSLIARGFIAAGYQWGGFRAVPLSYEIPREDCMELLWPESYEDIGRSLPTAASVLARIDTRRGDMMCCAWKSSSRASKIEHIVMFTSGSRIVHARGTKWGVRRDAASLYARAVGAVVRFNPVCDLRRGHRGRRVKALQEALQRVSALSLSLGRDGDFGATTEAAVCAFQRMKGLATTGRGDAATRAALGIVDSYAPERPMIQKGDTGDAVREIQARLVARGYKIEVDGEFGPKTDAALRAFQREAELVVDGQCGPITWAALLEDAGDTEDEA